MEEELQDKKQLLGSILLDNIQGKFAEAGSAIMEAAQDDPDTWTDDAIRIGLGGVKNVGTVLEAPGIKQLTQLVGAPAYYVGRTLGYGLERAGVDPRYGHIAGEVGEWFIPGYGMYKAAGKIVKTGKALNTLSKAKPVFKKRQILQQALLEGFRKTAKPVYADNIVTKLDELDSLGNTLSGTVKDITGSTASKRNLAAGMLSGNTVRESGRLLSTFNQYTQQIAETINSTLPRKISDRLWSLGTDRTARWHHVGPLKQVAASVNGLTDEAAKISADYIAENIGRKLGNLEGAGTPLPEDLHKRIHGLFNRLAGQRTSGAFGGYNIERHIQKLGWPSNWQTTIAAKQRKPLYDLIIDDIIKSEDAINTFWRRLNNVIESNKVNRKEYLESLFETQLTDSAFLQVYGATPPQNVTITEMIQGITGQVDESLTNIVNLLGNTPKSSAMYPILLQEQGFKALQQAILQSTDDKIVSATEIFKTYNINLTKAQEKIVNKLIKDDNAYQYMLRSRNRSIPPADSIWDKGQD